jgi:predicted ATPase
MDKFCTEKCNKNTSLCIVMSITLQKKLIAITGGPCCGKTTLLNNLAMQSYQTVPEAARMIIEEEQKRGSTCVPWIDLYGFQESAANRILELEHSFEDSLLFCDRGVVDGHGYSTNGKVPTPEIVRDLGTQRYGAVFILDPIPVYQKDDSRKENPEEAKKIHNAIWTAYREFGYTPIRVPVMDPKERARYFVKLVERIA